MCKCAIIVGVASFHFDLPFLDFLEPHHSTPDVPHVIKLTSPLALFCNTMKSWAGRGPENEATYSIYCSLVSAVGSQEYKVT